MSLRTLMVHRVDVQAPTISKYGTGGQKREFPPDGGKTRYRNQRCRVQPLSASKSAFFFQQGIMVTHRIYFDKRLTLESGDRVVFGDRKFEVKGFRDTDELKRLFVVEAEEKS